MVRDGWSSTAAAIKALGFKSPPGVVHEKGYRDKATGFHTNDVESENNRIKKWSRHRMGHLRLRKGDMDEYMFYVNYGTDMSVVMEGLGVANGGGLKNKLL